MIGPSNPRSLFLLRHASAENVLDGPDKSRPLSARGRREATAVGVELREMGIDFVLCSSAVRTRETLDLLNLVAAIPVEFRDILYVCGTNTLLQHVGQLSDAHYRVLVVGHSPTIPGLSARIASGAHPKEAENLWSNFPPATWTEFDIAGPWDALARMPYALGTLVDTRRPPLSTPGDR